MLFGIWNVRTLSEALKLEEICSEMDTYNLDIIGLSETHWIGVGNIETRPGYHFLYSGNSESKLYGVGILVKPAAYRSFLGHCPISERILTARFKTVTGNLTIIQCYAPTELKEYGEKDKFYQSLEETLDDVPEGDTIIVAGDFNARVGTDNTRFELVMGKHGMGEKCNDNGNRLKNLAEKRKLFIGGTGFEHAAAEKYTYVQKRGGRQQIDHILINQSQKERLVDVCNERQADINTDHLLVVAKLDLQLCMVNKFELKALKDVQIPANYRCKLREAIASPATTPTCANIDEILKQVACETLGQLYNREQSWLSKTTWERIESRKKLKCRLEKSENEEERKQMRQEYNAIQQEIRELAKEDEAQYNATAAMRITEEEIAVQLRDFRAQHCEYKQLTVAQPHLTPLKERKNSGPRRSSRQAARREAHIQSEANNCRPTNELKSSIEAGAAAAGTRTTAMRPCIKQLKEGRTSIDHKAHAAPMTKKENELINLAPPTANEIETAVKQLKIKEPSNPKDIPIQLLQHGLDELLPIMQRIFETIWRRKLTSKCKPKVLKLNAAPAVLQRILVAIIHQRMAPMLQSALRVEQRGCGRRASCIDLVGAVRSIIKKLNGKPLVLLFLHFEAPYETMRRTAIWERLRFLGIPEELVLLIEALYLTFDARPVGVREDCELSRLLCALVLDGVLAETNCIVGKGIELTASRVLCDLAYGDDICFLTDKLESMQRKMEVLIKQAENVGLQVDFDKTKVMSWNVENMEKLRITVGEKVFSIENVKKHNYLGCLLSKHANTDAAAAERIDLARCKFKEWQTVWESRKLVESEKLDIFRKIIMPVLLYGSEAWTLSKQARNRLDYFVATSLFTICQLRTEMDQQKQQWKVEISGRAENDIIKMAYEWKP
ncbi:uncharacterized protein LOC128858879 [Anastrepha ludens]|uniref:uncharacterized protein LOC128858879 n=1 Tax=Anastrepha ludens TaxID=28586 RepID=UPI0023AFC2FB|nr:uncharacterized protein LOC128858879 [Anastrepha ludens]